ncbi:MAG: RNA polymerase sigma factor [Gammaproteobacteria bacterium]|nr:RNA polymerase sigma factor [Gammaproteobacteria bacterium]
MKQVIDRDEIAFTELVDRYLNPLFSFVHRLCGNPQDAEDITQDTFVRVWERAKTWRAGQVQFKTWLYQIARNLCIDRFRKTGKYIEESLESNFVAAPERSSFEDEQKMQHLYKSIEELPERQRTAIVLCNLQGWSQSDVAQILGCSVNAVDALVGRGRQSLRIKLSKFRD